MPGVGVWGNTAFLGRGDIPGYGERRDYLGPDLDALHGGPNLDDGARKFMTEDEARLRSLHAPVNV